MGVNLRDSGSIILRLGDLKVSDTHDVFGKRAEVNGVLYQPLVNPGSSMSQSIGVHLALGDARDGVLIRENKNTFYFVYGANRPSSYAQSMAIGFHDKTEFVFLVEYFVMSEIYTAAEPRVSVRTIVRCSSLGEPDNGTVIKTVYNKDSDRKVEITKADKMALNDLLTKVRAVSRAFNKTNLDILGFGRRKRERDVC